MPYGSVSVQRVGGGAGNNAVCGIVEVCSTS